MHKEGEGYSYWPGYVDALTNIVLNLLFLVAIFVIGVAALGLVASKRKEVPEGGRVLAEHPAGIERFRDVVSKVIVSSQVAANTGNAVQGVESVVRIERITKTSNSIWIELTFAKGVYLISKAEEADLLHQLSAVLQATGVKLVVWTALQSDDALLTRGAMVRLLSVRNMLLQNGILPSLIEVRIFPKLLKDKPLDHVFIEINKDGGGDDEK